MARFSFCTLECLVASVAVDFSAHGGPGRDNAARATPLPSSLSLAIV